MRDAKYVWFFVVLLLLGLATMRGARADGPILVCVPFPIPAALTAQGWTLVNSETYAVVEEKVRNKSAEIAVAEAGTCVLFDSESGASLSSPAPVHMLFWRNGVQVKDGAPKTKQKGV